MIFSCSRAEARVVLMRLSLIAFALAVAVVTVVDVDGDPTTSNVTVVCLTEGRTSVDTAEDVIPKPETSIGTTSLAGVLALSISRWVRALWEPRSYPIRGP